MFKPVRVLAAICFLFTASVAPVQAELTLPPDVMEYATVGINGVYSLILIRPKPISNMYLTVTPITRLPILVMP